MRRRQILKSTERPNVAWGPLAAVLGTVFIFYGAQIIALLFISVYVALQGWSEGQTELWLEQSVVANFTFSTIVFLAGFGLIGAFLRRRKASWKDIGLIRPRKTDVAPAILGYLAYLALFLIAVNIVQAVAPGIDWQQEQEIGFSKNAAGLSLIYIFISLVIIPPIIEEVLDRGFLYTGLRTRFTVITSGIITSLLFAAAHLQWGSEAPLLWAAAIDTFLLSLVLVYLRERTGSLVSPILVHGIKNLVAFYVLFIIKSA